MRVRLRDIQAIIESYHWASIYRDREVGNSQAKNGKKGGWEDQVSKVLYNDFFMYCLFCNRFSRDKNSRKVHFFFLATNREISQGTLVI